MENQGADTQEVPVNRSYNSFKKSKVEIIHPTKRVPPENHSSRMGWGKWRGILICFYLLLSSSNTQHVHIITSRPVKRSVCDSSGFRMRRINQSPCESCS